MSVEKLQIYQCTHCGLIVEVLKAAAGAPVCCGEPMKLRPANTSDGAREKHVPVINGDGMGAVVRVGSVPHPMQPEHYIEWIEVINKDYVNRKELQPGEAPEAMFYVPFKPGLVVRAYCNLHGLWQFVVPENN